MPTSLYLTSPAGNTGKSTVALGLVNLFTRRVRSVGVFRPLVRTQPGDQHDSILEALLERAGNTSPYAESIGVSYDEYQRDPESATATILERFRALERKHDIVVVVGSDYKDAANPGEFALNARLAANLGTPIFLSVSALDRSPKQVLRIIAMNTKVLLREHAQLAGVFVLRTTPAELEMMRAEVHMDDLPVFVLPEHPVLTAPTVGEVLPAIQGRLLAGDPGLMGREVESILVAGMTPEHVLEHIEDGQLVIAPGDRSELLVTLLAAQDSPEHPGLSSIVLNGGYLPADTIMKLVHAMNPSVPIIATDWNTYETATYAGRAGGTPRISTRRKIDVALTQFEEHVEAAALVDALNVPDSPVRTPLMFQSDLVEQAREKRQNIVLPEPDDDRVLRAASTVLERGISDITFIGDEAKVRSRAAELGLNLSAAAVVSPTDPEYLEPFAEEFARLRAKTGITVDEAREQIQDVSYCGTMMVHMGKADGMVSGAAHTTAHTIVPSFRIIKTKPDTSIVSSVFFMCLEDRVLVYGDCAVNPEPTAEQLADIAISSAETAAQFGVVPKIAMLSYSTGDSGSGAEVDKVREATRLVKERRPDLAVEGPIQYDAAVDHAVAEKKLPDSTVAGQATVFIFPDLNTGNNTYKAVQRSAGALAIGPILQGLNKPVNDLSRGALVDDIVNTIAITAIQSQI